MLFDQFFDFWPLRIIFGDFKPNPSPRDVFGKLYGLPFGVYRGLEGVVQISRNLMNYLHGTTPLCRKFRRHGKAQARMFKKLRRTH